jgi:hypothetical protein
MGSRVERALSTCSSVRGGGWLGSLPSAVANQMSKLGISVC